MSWIAVAAVPLITRAMLLEARSGHPKSRRDEVIFPATGPTLLCAANLILATCVGLGSLSQSPERLVEAFAVVWAALSLWYWPTTIVLDKTGVVAKRIGRPNLTLPYRDIDFVTQLSTGETIIYGKTGVDIRTSEYHVAPSELLTMLKKHGIKCYYGGL